jgi:hypothetical protein
MNGCWNWLIRNFLPRQSETSTPVTLDGLPLSMQNSDYWIMNCGKELIASHGDIGPPRRWKCTPRFTV